MGDSQWPAFGNAANALSIANTTCRARGGSVVGDRCKSNANNTKLVRQFILDHIRKGLMISLFKVYLIEYYEILK
jgi:hypothetical protein